MPKTKPMPVCTRRWNSKVCDTTASPTKPSVFFLSLFCLTFTDFEFSLDGFNEFSAILYPFFYYEKLPLREIDSVFALYV